MPHRRSSENTQRALAGPLYAFALLLVLIPLLDFLHSVGIPQLANVQWRFATVGLLSSVLLTPMLGIAMAIVVAASRGHVLALRVFALICVIGAVLLAALIVGFALDILQLRNSVPSQGQAAFRSASLKAGLKHAGAALALGFLGIRAWRISAWRTPKAQQTPVPLVSR